MRQAPQSVSRTPASRTVIRTVAAVAVLLALTGGVDGTQASAAPAARTVTSAAVPAQADTVVPVHRQAAAAVTATPGTARRAGLPPRWKWLRDVRRALAPARPYLNRQARLPHRRKLAIVLDIDNTSLATVYDWPEPVVPTLRVARRARALGYSVFFVTGRYNDDLHRHVTKHLRKAGYRWAGAYGRRHGERVAHSKQRCRAAIVAKGYRIVANIGNHPKDFVGGHYQRAFRLPNYGLRLS